MKNILFALTAVLVFAGCYTPNGNKLVFSSLNPETDIPVTGRNSVSYEMYSWYNGQDWAYAIFENGTKITTSFKSITEDNNVIVGTDYLKDKILSMPKGTKIYWNLKRIKGFSMPDDKTVNGIINSASKNGISVEVIAWPS